MKTEQDQIKKYFKLGFLFLGISLLFFNCEKETYVEIPTDELSYNSVSHKFFSLTEIPKVKEFYDKTIAVKNYAKSKNGNIAIFNEEQVLALIDTLKQTNYSIQFVFSDSPKGEFYNLVIGKTAEGNLKKPFILKYVCDEEQKDVFEENNYDMSFFIGSIYLHKFTDFFDLNFFSKTNTPCPPNSSENTDACANQNVNFTGGYGGGIGHNNNGSIGYGNIGYSGGGSNGLYTG